MPKVILYNKTNGITTHVEYADGFEAAVSEMLRHHKEELSKAVSGGDTVVESFIESSKSFTRLETVNGNNRKMSIWDWMGYVDNPSISCVDMLAHMQCADEIREAENYSYFDLFYKVIEQYGVKVVSDVLCCSLLDFRYDIDCRKRPIVSVRNWCEEYFSNNLPAEIRPSNAKQLWRFTSYNTGASLANKMAELLISHS